MQVLDINGKYLIVGAQLADKICATLDVPKVIVAECNSDDLTWAGGHAYHPFEPGITGAGYWRCFSRFE